MQLASSWFYGQNGLDQRGPGAARPAFSQARPGQAPAQTAGGHPADPSHWRTTTGRFTRDAVAFAQGKPLELIDGEQLQVLVAQASNEVDGNLLDVARWSRRFAMAATVTKPACPFCRGTMVLREGRKSGAKFWGCQS